MQFSLTGSQENTSADLQKKVIYLQSNLTLQQVIFQYPNIFPQVPSFNQEMMELWPGMATACL